MDSESHSTNFSTGQIIPFSKGDHIDLTRPHRDFHYLGASPDFSQSNESAKDNEAMFSYWLDHSRGLGVQLYRNKGEALRSLLSLWQNEQGTAARLASLGPTPPALTTMAKLGVQLGVIPRWSRDPEDLSNAPYENIDILFISQVSDFDGFYYPQEILEKVVLQAIEKNPGMHIVCDESQTLFSYADPGPGSLRTLARDNPRIWILGSLYPAYAPQGPEFSWLANAALSVEGGSLTDQEKSQALYIFSELRSKSGAAVREASRRVEILRRGLRNAIDPLVEDRSLGHVRVKHWPDAGFYFALDLTLWPQFEGAKEFVARFERDTHIRLIAGDEFGEPDSVVFCFAQPIRILRKFGETLHQYLVGHC